MSRETEVFHHLSVRRRIHQKHEVYPHHDKVKRFFDTLIYIAGILGPLASIPQLVDVFLYKKTEGLSLFTWFFWGLLNIVWIVYGILHKEKPIILTYFMWLLVNWGIVLGILLYR